MLSGVIVLAQTHIVMSKLTAAEAKLIAEWMNAERSKRLHQSLHGELDDSLKFEESFPLLTKKEHDVIDKRVKG